MLNVDKVSVRTVPALIRPTSSDQIFLLQQYLRLQRINRALSVLENPADSFFLIALAQSLGYYDQSHFIHDFKSVCGITPTGYLQNMSDFYKETYKF